MMVVVVFLLGVMLALLVKELMGGEMKMRIRRKMKDGGLKEEDDVC